MNLVNFFRFQKRLLESLFPENWFIQTKKRNHPAFLRWDLCNRIIAQKGVILYPEQEKELNIIGRILLDSHILCQITGGSFQNLTLGSLDIYGDESIEKKIISRVVDEHQFEDVMTELYIGAWHKTRGHKVIPIEEDGFPDLKVAVPSVFTPIFIECKHLWTSSKRRIEDVVRKANKQLRKIRKKSYGVLLLDLNIPVKAGKVSDDVLPNDLVERLEVIESSLSGKKNRSVGVSVIVWDDHMILGKPPEPTFVVFRRRYKLINHQQPKVIVPNNIPLFEGFTVTYWLRWTHRFKFDTSESGSRWDSSSSILR